MKMTFTRPHSLVNLLIKKGLTVGSIAIHLSTRKWRVRGWINNPEAECTPLELKWLLDKCIEHNCFGRLDETGNIQQSDE